VFIIENTLAKEKKTKTYKVVHERTNKFRLLIIAIIIKIKAIFSATCYGMRINKVLSMKYQDYDSSINKKLSLNFNLYDFKS